LHARRPAQPSSTLTTLSQRALRSIERNPFSAQSSLALNIQNIVDQVCKAFAAARDHLESFF
jgi:hypothetical protein